MIGPFGTNKKPPGPSGRRRLGEHLCGALALTKEKLLGREDSLHNCPSWFQDESRRVKAIVRSVLRRLLRLTFKLGLIALIGFGIAVVVKKLTAPADTPLPIEPWTSTQDQEADATVS
jgi:hypothetical protein